ncbi:hypothetical protein I315_01420 [Cryptococcus gattii Ru294]|uniref:Tudor domain-containing protein n=1 Tax=Cryptococcus gattii EJB2 TaxID=1296103 RepID=A0ABR5C2W4_9TREE|nr:hypothetical protein I315_01420 [Cryptococcus gattii Ru294]KIR82001.1 hypothetical protein I306_00872 [Cryptococcus gattii EJB2]
MEAELQTYRDQLAYVNLSLESDPSNDDLLKLKAELNELIDLTQQAMGHTGAAKGMDAGKEKAKTKGKEKEKEITNWQDQGPYKAGMDCMAKYKDGKWYPARINAVVGSQESPLYAVTFKGYTSSTNLPLSSLKPHDPNAPIPQPQKRRADELTEKEKEKKKKKGEKWMETQKQRAEEVKEKKNAWEKFGKKAQKKGIHISGLEGRSVFRTPDNPYGRGTLFSVFGVVGSGRGVTEYERMGKHKFNEEEDD